MRLSLEYRKKFFRDVAQLLEQCRQEKGWSIEVAAIMQGMSIRRLLQMEYTAGGKLGILPLFDLLNIMAIYGKRLGLTLTDLQPEDIDPDDNEERQREWVLKQLEREAQKEADQTASDNT